VTRIVGLTPARSIDHVLVYASSNPSCASDRLDQDVVALGHERADLGRLLEEPAQDLGAHRSGVRTGTLTVRGAPGQNRRSTTGEAA
jgi:hypothetical protein